MTAHLRSLAVPFTLTLAALTPGAAAQSLLLEIVAPAPTLTYGFALADAGDVDGDGLGDLLVGDYSANQGGGRVEVRSGVDGSLLRLWEGTPGTDEWAGFAVTGLGDLDGDGHAEVAYSAPDFQDGQGVARVFVKDGATGATSIELVGSQAHRFGFALAGGGDADGDGRPELLIGEPQFQTPVLPNAHGRVHRVEVDGASFTSLDVIGPNADAPSGFGRSLAWLGDVDGDGDDEFAVAAPFWSAFDPFLQTTEYGQVLAYDGDHVALWSRIGSYAGADHGEALANVGDVDGDGAAELAVGASSGASLRGYVELLSGATGQLLTSRIGPPGSRFGRALAGVGDADGDGGLDLLVGAPLQELQPWSPADSGAVHVVRASDLSTLYARAGSTALGYLGQWLAPVQDLTGDGVPEVLAMVTGPSGGSNTVQVLDPTGTTAFSAPFGVGLSGTLGVPALSCDPPPYVGTTAVLHLGNSSGTPQLGAIFAGHVPTQVPLLGGLLYMVPTIVQWLPEVPAGGLAVPVVIPGQLPIVGSRFVVQGLQLDPGAVQGVSITPPIVLGIAGS